MNATYKETTVLEDKKQKFDEGLLASISNEALRRFVKDYAKEHESLRIALQKRFQHDNFKR